MPAWARVTICRTGGGEAGDDEPGDEDEAVELSEDESTMELERGPRASEVDAGEPSHGETTVKLESREHVDGVVGEAESVDVRDGPWTADGGGPATVGLAARGARPQSARKACTRTADMSWSLSVADVDGAVAGERVAKGKESSTKWTCREMRTRRVAGSKQR